MRHPEFWSLPGGRRYVRDVLLTARNGSVAVHEPLGPPQLALAIEESIRRDGLDECLRIDPDGSGDRLIDVLRRRVGSHATTMEGFALHLGYVVLVSAMDGPEDGFRSDLEIFASAAAARSDDAAPRVVAISRDGSGLLKGAPWRRSSTQGILDHLDGASFAATGTRGLPGLVGRLAVGVAMEVGAWDLDIVERIRSLPEAAAVRPDLHVERWSDERIGIWRGRAARWEDGTYDLFGGEPYVHPLLLAGNAPALLERRVWRGHVAALFPWLEEIRQDLARRYRRLLTIEAASYSGDIESLDWGPLCSQLGSRVPEVREFAHGCRRLRNCLAHGSPALWQDVDACLEAHAHWRSGDGGDRRRDA